MKNKDTHISTVKRIISAILPKFGNESKSQYELSQIARRIKKNNSNLYSPLSGKVQPYFQKLYIN